MSERAWWLMLAASLVAPSALAADAAHALTTLRVIDAKVVAPAQYGKAPGVAARGGTPVEIALAIAGKFEGSIQQIIQVNEGSESPTASRVTIVRDGLLDDSVRGQRWDVVLGKAASGKWSIRDVTIAWRCWRGPESDVFSATPCR
ncbi:MAG: hypothetical protein WBA53_03815 [Burkholderiaceae bacterium]